MRFPVGCRPFNAVTLHNRRRVGQSRTGWDLVPEIRRRRGRMVYLD